MAVRRTNNPPPQPSSNPLTALLGLSGLLTRSSTGGVFSEALTSLLTGTGLHCGVVHEMTSTGLELVAEEGLPQGLRAHIGSISLSAPPWFVVQQAVKRRRLIVEEDALTMIGSRVPEAILRSTGWLAVASAPMALGRDVLGAITIAGPGIEYLSPTRLAMLETVANVVALFLAHQRASAEAPAAADGPNSLSEIEEKLTRLATLGSLALGFADDLRAISSQLDVFIKNQEKWLQQLRVKHPGAAPVIRDLEPLQEEAASALMLARMSGGRLLAALDETALESVDLGSVVYDVVGHAEPGARAKNVDVLVSVQAGSDPIVRGKRSEIRQLVVGLVNDAVEACGREDKPDYPTAPPPQVQMLSVSVNREKNKIHLVVEHSGKGTATEHRQTSRLRSSRPKDPLGLFLGRNIVALLNGTIEVTRSDLGGALVTVTLPAAVPPPSSKRNKGGPASSKRARSIAAAEASPMTKRDGWTAKPGVITGAQAVPIRTPAPTVTDPFSESDMLASTERGSALAGAVPASPRGQRGVVITEADDSAAPSVPVPPSTRRRSQSGPTSKRRG
jgi:signal transduction histidine kinase